MSEITETPGQRTLRLKIGRDDLANLAFQCLTELLDGDLGRSEPELGSIAGAEFCTAIMKAIAHKCTRIEIEIDAESVTARGPVAGAGA